ncbi:hypothetical protein HPB48_003293 [Haemaphysalis longicornis]|uniref:Uncharacterized protein n=1 Tax=Haemaphysalis longicornis TaxID=44386 RepID=A0A9J6GKB6_HAELO|nr:hypothetical protein HPB48_003293 [Haemaphysalis longicornis]
MFTETETGNSSRGRLVFYYSAPEILLSLILTEKVFTAALVEEIMRLRRSSRSNSTRHHPATNGPTERKKQGNSRDVQQLRRREEEDMGSYVAMRHFRQ